jgi:hypothetical protein
VTKLSSSPERAEVIRGLEKFPQHLPPCVFWSDRRKGCDCGVWEWKRAALSLLRERPASETTKPVAAICPRQPNNGPHCACWSVGGICCKCREQRPASETEGT